MAKKTRTNSLDFYSFSTKNSFFNSFFFSECKHIFKGLVFYSVPNVNSRIGRIFELNQTNFERIQHLKNLTPPYSWSRTESNEFWINFHRIFRTFFAFSNQSNRKFSNRIDRISTEFQFDSAPTLWVFLLSFLRFSVCFTSP